MSAGAVQAAATSRATTHAVAAGAHARKGPQPGLTHREAGIASAAAAAGSHAGGRQLTAIVPPAAPTPLPTRFAPYTAGTLPPAIISASPMAEAPSRNGAD